MTARLVVLLLTIAAGCAGAAPRRPGDPTGAMPGSSAGEGGLDRGGLHPEDLSRASPTPSTLMRPLEAYLGRPIWLAAPGRQAEQWVLRDIGPDCVTVERTRTYRVLPARRIAEITWTDLTGIDPTPRIVLSPE